jgi:hypothetical protein
MTNLAYNSKRKKSSMRSRMVLMSCYQVRTRINHVAHDDEECWRPVVLATSQSGLFA